MLSLADAVREATATLAAAGVPSPKVDAELLAEHLLGVGLGRLRALMLGDTPAPEGYQFGEIRVDFRRAEVERHGARVDLLPREYKLLCYLIENRGLTLTRNRLLDEVWGYDAIPSTRTVDVHIAGLRGKIEPDPRHPRYILTVHSLGYKFVG